MVSPDRAAFSTDPLGYGCLAWLKWETARLIAQPGYKPKATPTKEDLKNPILWLTQARALTNAAQVILKSEPSWAEVPMFAQGVCDCQYCAVGLMLVGYSLETCLKAMLIIDLGIEKYIADEKRYRHHRLEELGKFLPDINDKERAILQGLTHFTVWAGRYPDPGADRIGHASEIFSLSERHKITAFDLFNFASRVMNHVQTMV